MVDKTNTLPPRQRSNRSTQPTSKSKKKKKRSSLRILFTIILSVFLLAGAAIGYVYVQMSGALDKITLGTGDVAEAVQGSITDTGKPIAIALLGIDQRPKGVRGGGKNTDVMMVVTLHPKTKKIVAVTMPRDAYVQVDHYRDRKANGYYAAFYNNAKGKGMSADGAELEAMKDIRKMLGDLYGIKIDHVATINFQGFMDVVDALGGVEVDVQMRMLYNDTYDGTDINLQPGIRTLNGEEALGYVRYRQSKNGKNMTTDMDRNRRQGEVVGAMFDKVLTINGMTKIGSIFDAAGKSVKTDMSEKEIKALIKKYYNIKRSDITFLTVDGSWKSPYIYLHQDSLAKARQQLQSNMAE
ncbi:LCP family protein [Paenibacillus yanchengensis]|uniref:LCP family protein n=1 Tax=Paenibacillus yanchengensis TaxID=2035833 RepID=A0ABW4YKP0_9BACL